MAPASSPILGGNLHYWPFKALSGGEIVVTNRCIPHLDLCGGDVGEPVFADRASSNSAARWQLKNECAMKDWFINSQPDKKRSPAARRRVTGYPVVGARGSLFRGLVFERLESRLVLSTVQLISISGSASAASDLPPAPGSFSEEPTHGVVTEALYVPPDDMDADERAIGIDSTDPQDLDTNTVSEAAANIGPTGCYFSVFASTDSSSAQLSFTATWQLLPGSGEGIGDPVEVSISWGSEPTTETGGDTASLTESFVAGGNSFIFGSQIQTSTVSLKIGDTFTLTASGTAQTPLTPSSGGTQLPYAFAGGTVSIGVAQSPQSSALTTQPLKWDSTPGNGIDLTYAVNGTISANTSVDLYWASGGTPDTEIGSPIITVAVPQGTATGSSEKTVKIDSSTEPVGATQLIAVADPDNAIGEKGDPGTTAAVVLPLITLGTPDWSDTTALSGFNYSYDVSAAAIPYPTKIAFYWSSTKDLSGKIGGPDAPPITTSTMMSAVDTYDPNQPAKWSGGAPAEAEYILTVADPDGIDIAAGGSVKISALRIHSAAEILANAVSVTVEGANIAATFIPGRNAADGPYTMAEAQVAVGVDHFNWVQQVYGVPSNWTSVTLPNLNYSDLGNLRVDQNTNDFSYADASGTISPISEHTPFYDPLVTFGSSDNPVTAYSRAFIYNGTGGKTFDLWANGGTSGPLPDPYEYYWNEPTSDASGRGVASFTSGGSLVFADAPTQPAGSLSGNDAFSFETRLAGVPLGNPSTPLLWGGQGYKTNFTWNSNAQAVSGGVNLTGGWGSDPTNTRPTDVTGGVFDLQFSDNPLSSPTTQVNLATSFNLMGITANGQKFSGGLDGGGNALSENLLGSSLTAGSEMFNLGATGAANVVQARGQTITLPAGSFATLQLLATGVNGNQTNQTFTVKYTDGTSKKFTQSLSDWYTPQNYAGESVALKMALRNQSNGNEDRRRFDVYEYTLTLDPTKTIASITLPNNKNVDVLAITAVAIVNAPAGVTAKAASSTETDLSWTAAGSSVTGYNVYRGTTAGGESTTPINRSPLAATATSFADTTGVVGNTYFYVVKAIGGPAISPASNEASATLKTIGSTTRVDLSGKFNLTGITADGARYSGGLDGGGNALSAKQLGASLTWNGASFNIAPAGSSNVIQAAGQTIGLPERSYSKVELLATSVNGNQTSQTFTVNYTDGTSKTFSQSISDWAKAHGYVGESVAVSMAYRNTSSGGRDHHTFDVYGYTLAVDNTKTVRSITLPNNKNVDVLAITVVN
jgi:hypothetical protein